MIDLALPAGVERQLIRTSVRPVPALRARPRTEADRGIDVVMVSGFFGTKGDFRELLARLAEAGFGAGLMTIPASSTGPGATSTTRSPGWPMTWWR